MKFDFLGEYGCRIKVGKKCTNSCDKIYLHIQIKILLSRKLFVLTSVLVILDRVNSSLPSQKILISHPQLFEECCYFC